MTTKKQIKEFLEGEQKSAQVLCGYFCHLSFSQKGEFYMDFVSELDTYTEEGKEALKSMFCHLSDLDKADYYLDTLESLSGCNKWVDSIYGALSGKHRKNHLIKTAMNHDCPQTRVDFILENSREENKMEHLLKLIEAEGSANQSSSIREITTNLVEKVRKSMESETAGGFFRRFSEFTVIDRDQELDTVTVLLNKLEDRKLTQRAKTHPILARKTVNEIACPAV